MSHIMHGEPDGWPSPYSYTAWQHTVVLILFSLGPTLQYGSSVLHPWELHMVNVCSIFRQGLEELEHLPLPLWLPYSCYAAHCFLIGATPCSRDPQFNCGSKASDIPLGGILASANETSWPTPPNCAPSERTVTFHYSNPPLCVSCWAVHVQVCTRDHIVCCYDYTVLHAHRMLCSCNAK